MDTLMPMTCYNKLTMPLTFSKQRQMASRQGFSYLINPPAIRDERWMLSQHERCQKIHAQAGGTTRMVPKCERQIFKLTTFNKPRMVQRNGNYNPWTWALAWEQAECTVWRIQVWSGEKELLLSSPVIHTAWFRESEVSPWGIHHILRPYLWILSKVSLWAQFYQAVLGGLQS